jgi:hypothetical protein
VLKAKFVGPAGLVSSVGSAFIENEPGWEQLPADLFPGMTNPKIV